MNLQYLAILPILFYSNSLLADPAFFEQREWIRNQSQPPTSPYQQAAKQTREMEEKNRELREEEEALKLQPPQPLDSQSDEDENEEEE